MSINRNVKAALLTVAVAIAVGTVPAGAGAAEAGSAPSHAILRAIL